MSRTYYFKPVSILVLVSGNGTNLQALLDAEKSGALDGGKIAAVIADRNTAYALERAKMAGIPVYTEEPDFSLSKTGRRRELSERILCRCREKQIDLIVNAGFLSILAGSIIEEYSGRIINLHPALLPKFGGQGMYGEHVHRAVLDARESESGCTVHLVDAGIDTGVILLQRKVPVLPGDSPESLAERIQKEEHIAIVEGVKIMIGRLEEKRE